MKSSCYPHLSVSPRQGPVPEVSCHLCVVTEMTDALQAVQTSPARGACPLPGAVYSVSLASWTARLVCSRSHLSLSLHSTLVCLLLSFQEAFLLEFSLVVISALPSWLHDLL